MFKSSVRILIALAALASFSAKARAVEADSGAKPLVSNASLSDTGVKAVFDSLGSGAVDDLFIDDYFEGIYFSNLRENFGNNAKGSCSYVALGMLLSFYDSYWDDTFIPETYDKESVSSFVSYGNSDLGPPSYHAESPGVLFEPSEEVNPLSLEDYLLYVSSNSSTYFQCKLISLSQTYFGNEKFESSANPFGMTFADIQGFLGYYLYQYRGFSTSQVAVSSCNDPNLVRSYAIGKIKEGVPVLLRSRSPSLGGHAFVAYDYDENTDEVYVHTGWRDDTSGKALTHVSLPSTGFTQLADAISLDISMAPSVSSNYLSKTGDRASAQSFIFPQNIELASGNYRDELPAFSWRSVYKEKWVTKYDPFFDVSLLDSSSQPIAKAEQIRSRSLTLSQEQWDKTLSSGSNSYYVYVELNSEKYPYWDDYFAKRSFAKPLEYSQIPQMKPSEYGFDDAYPSSDSAKSVYASHTASHGFEFETRRFRTGYIHNEYIVMSPIRKGFKEAFIEYNFSSALTRIDVELAHWRPSSHEWLTSKTGKAAVQYYWGNKWVDKLDLLSSSTALPTDRNAHAFYKIEFENPVYRVRFHSEVFSDYSNDSNRGRICIGNMAFYPSEYSLPLSGGELDYEPEEWKVCQSYTNCYAYALNVKTNPYHGLAKPWALQPGTSDSMSNPSNSSYLTKPFLEKMVRLDSENYNFTFREIKKGERCRSGTYKVALAIDPGRDYHWYRQNSDGTWSHKPGEFSVREVDYKDSLIYDPETCDRRFFDLNYTLFCGFYDVGVGTINVNIY